MNRRAFLAYSTYAISALSVVNKLHAANIKKIGLQLYSLREMLEKDLDETLKQIAAIGYSELESFPSATKGHYWGYTAEAFQQKVNNLGMQLISTHIPFAAKDKKTETQAYATLQFRFEEFVDSCAKAGLKYIVCPNIPVNFRSHADDYRRLAELFNKCGLICKGRKLQFCYHNHDFEFHLLDGEVPYEILLQHTDRHLVNFELDLYWVHKAGAQVSYYLDKYPGRYHLYHVKDMGCAEGDFVPVGTGCIDFAQIFSKNKKTGVRHFFVEQDMFNSPELESLNLSFKNLKKLTFP